MWLYLVRRMSPVMDLCKRLFGARLSKSVRRVNETLNGHPNRRVLSGSWPISVAVRTHLQYLENKRLGAGRYCNTPHTHTHGPTYPKNPERQDIRHTYLHQPEINVTI